MHRLHNVGRGDRGVTSFALQSHIFVRARERPIPNESEGGLLYTRTNSAGEGDLPDRRSNDTLEHELLHLMEYLFTLRPIELRSLLLEQCVEIRVTAVGPKTTLARADATSCVSLRH